MRSRLLASTILVLLLLVMFGTSTVQAQIQDFAVRNSSWETRAVTGSHGNDDEGDDEASDCPPYPMPLAQTGQTISDHGGDDGEFQMGLPSPTPRFTYNDNGTVTDNLTGLIWLRAAQCLWSDSWANAVSAANDLSHGDCFISDGSVDGDWRLPNFRELHSLIDFGQVNPALPDDHLLSGVHPSPYWSSTTDAGDDDRAWAVILYTGTVITAAKNSTRFILPVRGPE